MEYLGCAVIEGIEQTRDLLLWPFIGSASGNLPEFQRLGSSYSNLERRGLVRHRQTDITKTISKGLCRLGAFLNGLVPFKIHLHYETSAFMPCPLA